MKFQVSFLRKFAAFAVMTALATTAFAQSAGDTVFSAGWFHIMPQDSSTPLQVTSPIQTTLQGSGATLENIDTSGISITRFITDNWAVALDLGYPPKYKLNGTGTLGPLGRLGTARQWAPALIGKYYFGQANSPFRPLLGLGVARVFYTNVELTSNLQQFIGNLFSDPTATTTADLDSSWSPVFVGGLSYAFNKNWYGIFTLSYLKMKSTAELTTNTSTVGQVRSNTELTIDPIVTFLQIGYRF